MALHAGFTFFWLQRVDPIAFMKMQMQDSGQWDKMPADQRAGDAGGPGNVFPLLRLHRRGRGAHRHPHLRGCAHLRLPLLLRGRGDLQAGTVPHRLDVRPRVPRGRPPDGPGAPPEGRLPGQPARGAPGQSDTPGGEGLGRTSPSTPSSPASTSSRSGTIGLLAIGFGLACRKPASSALWGVVAPWAVYVLGKSALAALF